MTGPPPVMSRPAGISEAFSIKRITLPLGTVLPIVTGKFNGRDFARTPNHEATIPAAWSAFLLGGPEKAKGIEAEELPTSSSKKGSGNIFRSSERGSNEPDISMFEFASTRAHNTVFDGSSQFCV